MISISYLHSPTLNQLLGEIEQYRQAILLTPLTPQKELELRWSSTIEQVYWQLKLINRPLARKELLLLFGSQSKRQYTEPEREAMHYKNALDYLAQNWPGSQEVVTTKTVFKLHSFVSNSKFGGNETDLKQLIDYLQVKPDHAVIQAAIAMLYLLQLKPFKADNEKVAQLLSLLFLYKYGYDCKGFFTLEEYWQHASATLRGTIEQALNTGNITPWLEYFAQAMQTQLAKAAETLLKPDLPADEVAVKAQLNDRQKAILIFLENPEASLTNMKVQRLYKVSQITASRDLAKLTTLGLLIPHGKGRSIYYTRI